VEGEPILDVFSFQQHPAGRRAAEFGQRRLPENIALLKRALEGPGAQDLPVCSCRSSIV
jgi:hypothetical protein